MENQEGLGFGAILYRDDVRKMFASAPNASIEEMDLIEAQLYQRRKLRELKRR
jgi:hypothetical protein